MCLPTYGHTPGHQSLKLRLPGGDVVLAADSCYFCRTLRERRLPRYVYDREAMLGYVRAYSRAVRWLYGASNKDRAVDILVKYGKQDRTDSANTYDYFVTKLRAFSTDGQISEATFKRMEEALVGLGDLAQPLPAAEKFLDPSFVKAAWAGTSN